MISVGNSAKEMSNDQWTTGVDVNNLHNPEYKMHPRPQLPVEANPKKKRRTTSAKSAPRFRQIDEFPGQSMIRNLRPPPPSCFGDTVSAANPFDDATPRSSRSIDPPRMRTSVTQLTSGPSMRSTNPMIRSGIDPRQLGINHANNEIGRISPMGAIQSPAVFELRRDVSDPSVFIPVGRMMSRMNNMGLNRSPGAANQRMVNHANAMGGISPMGQNHRSSIGIDPMGKGIASSMREIISEPTDFLVGRMSLMNNNNMGFNQTPGGINHRMGNRLDAQGSAHINQLQGERTRTIGDAARASVRFVNGSNQHCDSSETVVGNVNGPFGRHGSQPRHLGTELGNVTTMGSFGLSNNANVAGRNSNNASRIQDQDRTGSAIPMGFVPDSFRNGTPMRNPISVEANSGYRGLQPHPGIRSIAPPSADKIYPGDQPIIFNPQNRNVPPIYPCGSCRKEVNDSNQGIVCESGCNFWFHRQCVGLTEAAFQLLNEQVFAEWVCDGCLKIKNVPPIKCRT